MGYETDVTTTRAPGWLRGTWGQLFLGMLGNVKDVIATAAKDAVKARFVATAPIDALGWIGRERNIERYAADTDATYRARLADAWDIWELAGTESVISRMLTAAGQVTAPLYWRVNNAPTWIGADPWPPAPRLLTSDWSRFWVELQAPFMSAWELLRWADSGNEWGNGHTWGSSATTADLLTVRRIINKWRPARDRCEQIIIRLDDGMAGLYPLYVPCT